MKEFILETSLYFAFIVLSVGIFFQRKKLLRRGTSGDISLIEVNLRLAACFVLLTKFIVVGDMHLIIGQGVFNLMYLAHYITVLRLRPH